ncbi:MAG TPA: hypothetical protein VGM03_04290 [Phycisphaerae bacterium]
MAETLTNSARRGKTRAARRGGQARRTGDGALPETMMRIPRLLQEAIDHLVAKGKQEALPPREQTMLDEALLYLAELWVCQLERRLAAKRRRTV